MGLLIRGTFTLSRIRFYKPRIPINKVQTRTPLYYVGYKPRIPLYNVQTTDTTVQCTKDRPNDVIAARCFCSTSRADEVTSSLSARCLCATPRVDEVTSTFFVRSLRSSPEDPQREDSASADPLANSEACGHFPETCGNV